MSLNPVIVGILNISEDSFSDGGRYLSAPLAIEHAFRLAGDGASIIELGPASSHPGSKRVSASEEIERIAPVIDALGDTIRISVDSTNFATQRYAVERGVEFINDVQGFQDEEAHALLAASGASAVVVHSAMRRGKSSVKDLDARDPVPQVVEYLLDRINVLVRAGVARERLIVDPGLGYFLGHNPQTSIAVLRSIRVIVNDTHCPLMISASRKSFLRNLTSTALRDIGSASVAAEVFAALLGASYIRTHDPKALQDALVVWRSLLSDSSPDLYLTELLDNPLSNEQGFGRSDEPSYAERWLWFEEPFF